MATCQPTMRSSGFQDIVKPSLTPGLLGSGAGHPGSGQTVVCEGWVLKKRRKKMQGFARRYFVMYSTGLLQYSFEPGQPVRDQLSLQHAAISTSPGRRDIHIDSNTATFHVKCLTTGDFDMWMGAFRKFIALGLEGRRSTSTRNNIRQGNVSSAKSENVLEAMGTTIYTLEKILLEFLQEVSHRRYPSTGKKSEKEKHRDHTKDVVFNLFKKRPNESGEEVFVSDSSPKVQQILLTLEQLKNQHAALLGPIHAVQEPHLGYHVSLPPTVEDVQESEKLPERSQSSLNHRNSISTNFSDGTHEWYDAVDDGLEEFVVEPQQNPEQEHAEGSSDASPDGSRSSLEHFIQSSNDLILEESYTYKKNPQPKSQPIDRRAVLPSPTTGDEGSLFTILKKNVGKDLSTITFPVNFNEPLTLLQRTAEEVEYSGLLDSAAQANNPADRLAYVAAFAVSGYAHTRHRSGRKGFNPMLAETFEDSRMKFIAEKVRHNPVEMAYHAEGDGWELTATSSGRTKFWGKSLEIIPQGVTRLRIGSDQFIWTKPSSFMRNLMVGTKYLEHCGNLIVENATNRYRCVLEFKQNGYWGPSNVVSGSIYSPDGHILSQVEGKWDDQLSQTADSSNFHVLWRMAPFPKQAHEYYGFTAFGITLNEITPDLVDRLPPTDSRNRPDVRALENGDLDTAEAEKHRIEEMQRERRKKGQDRQPRWFKLVGNEWIYTGGYWEARANGWKDADIQPLW